MPEPEKTAASRTDSAREIIVRNPNATHSPDIKLPAKRINDFIQATEAVCSAKGPDEMLKALLNITSEQFNAHQTWCALRNLPEGEMTSHAGKSRDGHPVELKQIPVNERITEAVDKGEFVLLPRVTTPAAKQKKIRSAMITPLINPSGCFGVLYVDNSMDQEGYRLSDLDYLMLIAIHTAAILENF